MVMMMMMRDDDDDDSGYFKKTVLLICPEYPHRPTLKLCMDSRQRNPRQICRIWRTGLLLHCVFCREQPFARPEMPSAILKQKFAVAVSGGSSTCPEGGVHVGARCRHVASLSPLAPSGLTAARLILSRDPVCFNWIDALPCLPPSTPPPLLFPVQVWLGRRLRLFSVSKRGE